jgi:hypothetical protein
MKGFHLTPKAPAAVACRLQGYTREIQQGGA